MGKHNKIEGRFSYKGQTYSYRVEAYKPGNNGLVKDLSAGYCISNEAGDDLCLVAFKPGAEDSYEVYTLEEYDSDWYAYDSYCYHLLYDPGARKVLHNNKSLIPGLDRIYVGIAVYYAFHNDGISLDTWMKRWKHMLKNS